MLINKLENINIKRNLYYEDFEIGETYPDFELSISKEDLAVHRSCYDYIFEYEKNEKGHPGSEVISPFVLNSFLAMRASFGMPNGVLHSREELVMHTPAYVSDRLKVELSVLNKYKKNGRPFLVFRHRIMRENREPVMDVNRTVCWVLSQEKGQE